MGTELEDLVRRGESIVFLTRHSLGSIAVFIGMLSAILAGPILSVDWIFAIGFQWVEYLIALLFIVAPFAWSMWNRGALVTDRRVLYATRVWKRSVAEAPLEDIESLNFHPGFNTFGGSLSIRCSNGKEIDVWLLPKLQELRDAIASRCGLDASPRIESKVVVSTGLLNGLGCIGVVSGFIWSSASAVDFFRADPVALPGAAFYGLMVFAPVGVALGTLAGAVLAYVLGLACLRFILSPEQAHQFLHLSRAVSGGDWKARFLRLDSLLSATVLGWLYGRSLRPQ